MGTKTRHHIVDGLAAWLVGSITTVGFAQHAVAEQTSTRYSAAEMYEVPPEAVGRVIYGEVKTDADSHSTSERGFDPSGMWLRAYMTPVRDQGPRGTCASFAMMAVLEYNSLEDLSEQCLAAAQEDDGRPLDVAMQQVNSGFVFTEASCPYSAFWPTKLPFDPKVAVAERKQTAFARPCETFDAPGRSDPVEVVRQQLRRRRPAAVGVFSVGDWWRDGAYIPIMPHCNRDAFYKLSFAASVRIKHRNETLTAYNPADPRQIEAARCYFAQHSGEPRVGEAPFWENGSYVSRTRGWDSYLTGVSPLTIPQDEEVMRSCLKLTPTDNKLVVEAKYECPAHAIVITGIDEQNQALQFKNSWGTSWKQEGYGYMTFEYFRRFHLLSHGNKGVVCPGRDWLKT